MNPKDAVTRIGRKAWSRVVRSSVRSVRPRTVSAFSLSDAQFLAEFNLPQVHAWLESGDIAAAKQALLQHYGCRKRPAWPPFPRRFTDAPDLSKEELLRKAEDILEHKFGDERIWLGYKIDWHYNPTPDPRARWTREVHRHRWLALLGVAFSRTGDEQYARAFVDLMLDWIRSNPMPSRKNEADVAWTLMGVGMRGLIWPAAFNSFYQSLAFSDDAKFTMLRSIYDHAQFLYRFKTQLNHVLRESNGLISLGTYFCEFKRAQGWRQTALARLGYELVEHVNEDGSSVEMSTGYQWLVTDEFEGTRVLLKECGLQIPHVDLDQWLIKLYTVLAYILRPDGVWPRLDDGFMEDDAIQREKLAAAGERFGRPDIIYIATQGARGREPNEMSSAFRDAGLYVMRSDWTRSARYLLLDAGPFGGPHGHEDKLGIEVYAYGKPFIVDPGCYTYNAQDPYREYFASSRAHSTAMIAGKSQIRRWDQHLLRPRAGMRGQATWISCGNFDYAEGTYQNGYSSFSLNKPQPALIIGDVSHVRRVLFVKPDYWLIVDQLTSTGKNHDYEVLFNLAPDIRIEPASRGSICMHPDDGSQRMYLLTVGTDPCGISTACGSVNPIQGWYANGWYENKLPSITVICQIKNVRSTVVATLLYPCVGEQDILNLEVVAMSRGNGLAYRVTSSLGIDYLMLSSNRKKKCFGPCVSEAMIAGFRTRANELPVQLFSWH